ncbi:MAG: cation diffusion facilitator family transporter [Nitrososphaerota archaeon]|jgi:cation diffusion facilitator family transporter|nr:cation diffusion facilitator family transporter [Nitrososphaerota archaeon]
MAQNRNRRFGVDLADFILLVLYKEGAQSIEQLEEKDALQTIRFIDFDRRVRRSRRYRGDKNQLSVAAVCHSFLCKDWVKFDVQAKYELTDIGKVEAEQIVKNFEETATRFETRFFSPSAAAKSTTVRYAAVSVLKMVAGLISGSVGLIADGADTVVDTVASGVVWAGIKFKKEVIGTITIIGLLFLAAIILFYHSVSSIYKVFAGTFQPMTMPYIVIAVELIAMLVMFTLSAYQRLVGKRSKNLALISLSIDSKNAVYSAAAVIIGAVCSIFGIYWVDAIVGIFIAIRITIDGINLIHETTKTLKGETIDFSKFELPFEKQINQRHTTTFQHWIMYTIHKNKISTKKEIVTSLKKTFQHSYLSPIFTGPTIGEDTNFDTKFDELITPLIQTEYLTENNNSYKLTDKGQTYIQETINKIRYKQTNPNQTNNHPNS